MLVGLFLVYLAVFIAVLYAIEWLLGTLSNVTATSSAEFIVALGGMGAAAVLIRYNLGGIVMTVVIAVFWSLLLFGTASTYLTPTLLLAAAALYAAAAATVMESFLRGGA
ncbi:MAG: hypothetical protein J2P53_15080 [Bradyrhizobiaceae bacterium]|nr:hypothetical protein [Bradyrhizobiaceae bacterium]